jgi:selenocysteine lyase/cysteine desulfurase
MNAALETLLEFGIDAIEPHILALNELLIEQLQSMNEFELITPLSPEERSGIVTVLPKEEINPDSVFQYMAERKVDISLREGKLRFSPHYYNTQEEILAAIDILKEAVHRRGEK